MAMERRCQQNDRILGQASRSPRSPLRFPGSRSRISPETSTRYISLGVLCASRCNPTPLTSAISRVKVLQQTAGLMESSTYLPPPARRATTSRFRCACVSGCPSRNKPSASRGRALVQDSKGRRCGGRPRAAVNTAGQLGPVEVVRCGVSISPETPARYTSLGALCASRCNLTLCSRCGGW